ncbi:MAG: class I SAM-dependent methyltransferase [Chloroflexota bacterium]|nr:class I SAM-dependent methyltransferase [Chloroflexota bacterium]
METLAQRAIGTLYGFRRWLLKQPVFNSTILPAIPRPLRWLLRKVYFAPADLLQRLRGTSNELAPPNSANFSGFAGSYTSSGHASVKQLVDLGVLAPDYRVLDVGCGVGRLALPLTEYLSADGSYDGLDIVPKGIEWCKKNIAPRHPSFRFELADVWNKEYNPKGASKASEYRFPYDDDSFDLVVLVSVFTHMLTDDMENYVSEIARVLKPGGHCFATYYLVNHESRRLMEAGKGTLHFKHNFGAYWSINGKVPELSVAFDESYTRKIYEDAGLSLEDGIHYGGWCGRAPSPVFGFQDAELVDQDVVLATKR